MLWILLLNFVNVHFTSSFYNSKNFTAVKNGDSYAFVSGGGFLFYTQNEMKLVFGLLYRCRRVTVLNILKKSRDVVSCFTIFVLYNVFDSSADIKADIYYQYPEVELEVRLTSSRF